MSSDNVLVDIKDGIALITINREKKLNALNRELIADLGRTFESLRRREDFGAAIVTGAGDRAFIAGADIAELAALNPLEARSYALEGQSVLYQLENLGKPVIAAINGFALGGGLELAMACTLRVASETAKLGQPEVNIGLMPGFAGTQRLPRIVGKGRALELLLTGEAISAKEAWRIGLVNRVTAPAELMSEANKLAAQIASKAPVAVSLCLDAVQRGLDGSLAEGSSLEAVKFGMLFATEDMKEGTQAFLNKRAPKFVGR